ncbi:hypothetical protein RHMOL_Rhmol13G0147800 [Rhododendron molle]|uniref:Uncharacterized protein n=2 Tax=Rhododendron molle TaxID=49168 RepID=A0ACC0L8D6_RHOML|nr:hypothetical protein RHMOL_Rhmol13G0147800 [Rhododendron molle]KAI8524409.1 hypothetical protein RHMOL_Rhmol13G0147800 [Rhododendron molle]
MRERGNSRWWRTKRQQILHPKQPDLHRLPHHKSFTTPWLPTLLDRFSENGTRFFCSFTSLSPSHTRCSGITSVCVCVCVCVCRTSSSPLLSSPLLYSTHTQSPLFPQLKNQSPFCCGAGSERLAGAIFNCGPISALRDLSFPKTFGKSFPLFAL